MHVKKVLTYVSVFLSVSRVSVPIFNYVDPDPYSEY